MKYPLLYFCVHHVLPWFIVRPMRKQQTQQEQYYSDSNGRTSHRSKSFFRKEYLCRNSSRYSKSKLLAEVSQQFILSLIEKFHVLEPICYIRQTHR